MAGRYRGGWHGLFPRPAGLQPCRLGQLHLAESLFRRLAKARARLQVRDVGNIAAVFLAVEQVDVVIAHKLSLSGSSFEYSLRAFMTVKVQDPSHGLSDHADTSQDYCALAVVASRTTE